MTDAQGLLHAFAASLRHAATDLETAADRGEPLRIDSAIARLEELSPCLRGLSKTLNERAQRKPIRRAG